MPFSPRTWLSGETWNPAAVNDIETRVNSGFVDHNTRITTLETAPTSTLVSTFTNSWVNYDANRPAGYVKQGVYVVLFGLIKSGTVGSAAFTLPVGFRPTSMSGQERLFAVTSNALFGVVGVSDGGAVRPVVGSNVYFALDGIVFSTV